MPNSHATPRYDLVIVGASFAGLVAARTAAMRGLSVAVLEAKSNVAERVATTGILVKEAAEEIDIPHGLTRRVHGVRLYGPSLKSTDLFAPGYFFLTTDTGRLLTWLAAEAQRAGARLLLGTRFSGAERHGDAFRFQGLNIEARYIVGADGARSRVARVFGLGVNSRFLVGLEAEYEGLTPSDPRFLHCFLDSRLAPGYLAWVAPGPSVTQVGLAVTKGRRADLPAFLDHTRHLFDYAGARVVERRAGRIPSGGLVRPWSAPGVMLIGDAAGVVSPATGGGIRLAFQLGRRAAHAIADHLLDCGPAPERVVAAALPRFGVKLLMRSVLDLAPPNALIDLALATPAMRWLASHVYFHRRGAGGMRYDEFEARLAKMKSLPERATESEACAR
ncbi:MAG: NAD(P)/FAD-dependent oxidoreductase [Hyphomicrobiaceae bacterium]